MVRITCVGQSETDDGPADLYLIVYSCVDKASFQKAEEYIGRLSRNPLSRNKPIILVANKIDLARSRAVSVQGNHLTVRMIPVPRSPKYG